MTVLPIFFIIMGLILVWKIYQSGVAIGVTEMARGLLFFGIAGGFVFGAVGGEWAWLIGILVLAGLFYGGRFAMEALAFQDQREQAQAANRPPPAPKGIDFSFDDER